MRSQFDIKTISQMKNKKYIPFFLLATVMTSYSCRRDLPVIDIGVSGYPNDVGKIILTKCATQGCHNDASKEAVGGLSMSSWDKLFEGGRGGSVVIPFRYDFSTLFFFTNTYSDLGVVASPRMPYSSDGSRSALTREEILILKDWINAGAPKRNGMAKFSDDPFRKKIYCTNQGCDVVTVFDEQTSLPMRYINVGNSANIESPHRINVSPDGQYWYVVFIAGNSIQKYRTSDDSYVGEINIGFGNWNNFVITSDSKKAFVIDWDAQGKIYYLDLEDLSKPPVKYQGANLFTFPHGGALNNASTMLYITAQIGNFIYKLDVTNPLSPNGPDQIVLQTGESANTFSKYDPHEVAFSPDETKYFVTCQKSNEVRVFQSSNDSLLAVIPVGIYPQEMTFSLSTPYLFVTCMEDSVAFPFPNTRGCVSVINYQTNSFVKNVNVGFQPHGIVVDDLKKEVYVANRNRTQDGPAPHHTTGCGGRDGFITFIDMQTLDLIPNKKYELSVDPYSIAIRK